MGAVDHHGGGGVDDAGAGVVDVVGADEGAFFVAEDAGEGGEGGLLEGGVDFFDGGFFLEFEDAVGEGGIEKGNADRDSIEEAFELGVNHGDGGGASGGGGNEGVDGGAGAAEVGVWGVDDGLGVGEVVHGGDHAVLDAEGFVDDFDGGGDAVGGAGGGGDEMVLGRIVKVVIATHDDVERAFFDGGGDDDFFDALVEVVLEKLRSAELAGALEDDVAVRPVGGFDGVVLGVGDAMAVDREGVFVAVDVVIPSSVNGVELEEVG